MNHGSGDGQRLTEEEAFTRASDFFESRMGPGSPRFNDSRRCLQVLERTVLAPALKLQVAGQCLLAGLLGPPALLPAAFSMFLVDHLWMGWVSLLSGQYRVAFTLCRGAVEAATFEVASGLTPERFEPMWRSGTCTAGRVLASIGKQWPPKLHEDLSIAWKCCRGFGHPSVQPVIFPSFPATLPDGREARAIAFGGDESQPVDEPLLNFLGGFYCIAAEAGVDAMAVSLAGHFVERGRWEREYQALKDQRRIAIVSPGG